MKVYEIPLIGGLEWFPYQMAFGMSLRWGSWKAVRMYCGPAKVWLNIGGDDE